MFRKKKKKACSETVLNEVTVPAFLPVYGLGLNTFVPSLYSLLDMSYLTVLYENVKTYLQALIETTDEYTPASVCDSYIGGQIRHIRSEFMKECAKRNSQCNRIIASRETRRDELTGKKDTKEEKIEELKAMIKPLKDLHAQHEIKIGSLIIPVGTVVTIIAMIIDGLVNYSYIESIILQSFLLLIICVVCLSVMSDGCMWCLGNLVSKKEEDSMSRATYRILFAGFLTMFCLSVVASVMIRFGSMATTYGSLNAAGQFVGKDSYTLAEWGISLVTAFLTTATGLISYYASVDKNAHLVSRRRAYEKELAALEQSLEPIMLELSDLENAEDPRVLDRECREAAEENLRALEAGLKLHARYLLSLHQQNASYTDAASESGTQVLTEQEDREDRDMSREKVSEPDEADSMPGMLSDTDSKAGTCSREEVHNTPVSEENREEDEVETPDNRHADVLPFASGGH